MFGKIYSWKLLINTPHLKESGLVKNILHGSHNYDFMRKFINGITCRKKHLSKTMWQFGNNINTCNETNMNVAITLESQTVVFYAQFRNNKKNPCKTWMQNMDANLTKVWQNSKYFWNQDWKQNYKFCSWNGRGFQWFFSQLSALNNNYWRWINRSNNGVDQSSVWFIASYSTYVTGVKNVMLTEHYPVQVN